MAGLQETPKGIRLHIGIFGRRNAGKSSVINCLTKQSIALVSDIAGTTTDPVYKAMEIAPIGPVMIIDTAGIDDEGALGELRIGRTKEVMGKTDIAMIVIDAKNQFSTFESSLIQTFKELGTPIILVLNKIDTVQHLNEVVEKLEQVSGEKVITVSAQTGEGFDQLREELIALVPKAQNTVPFVGDLIQSGDTVVYCVPIDTAAPKGRLILPQVIALRDTLDHNAIGLITKENDLSHQIQNLKEPPALVVTDSQVFDKANQQTPKNIRLTSFSILMARQKGNLTSLVEGATAIDRLKPGDRVLIAEACTHVCQVDDIGKVKIPKMLQAYVGGPLNFDFSTGECFPENLSNYQLVIHCGACMINRKAMLWRQKICSDFNVPMVNYGVCIAKLHGILPRALSPFPELQAKVQK
ncbi:MAG: [Burkholderiaceae bacterium]|nr:[FeFe] hydrogenase H-cluster maturation GTPase HydF [Burkholderiaceae bacterium]